MVRTPTQAQVCDRHLVTVLAPQIDAATLEGVTAPIAGCGGNIERIVRLSSYPVHSYELWVAGADLDALRRALAAEAAYPGSTWRSRSPDCTDAPST